MTNQRAAELRSMLRRELRTVETEIAELPGGARRATRPRNFELLALLKWLSA
jgi:hypothetical protein